MNFHLDLRISGLLNVIVVTNQATESVDLCNVVISVSTRHDSNRLRVLVCDTSNKNTVIIQSLRTTVSRDLDFCAGDVRYLKVQDDVVTGSLFTGVSCGRIVVNVVQDTGNARAVDLDIGLEIIYVLAEEIFSRVDISIGDKRQVGFTSSSRAIADFTRVLAPEIRVSISCSYLLKWMSKSLKLVISPPLVAPT